MTRAVSAPETVPSGFEAPNAVHVLTHLEGDPRDGQRIRAVVESFVSVERYADGSPAYATRKIVFESGSDLFDRAWSAFGEATPSVGATTLLVLPERAETDDEPTLDITAAATAAKVAKRAKRAKE